MTLIRLKTRHFRTQKNILLTKKTTTAGMAALLCRSKYGRYHGQNIIGSMGKIAIFPNYASEDEEC